MLNTPPKTNIEVSIKNIKQLNYQKINSGTTADIYRYTDNQILKLFKKRFNKDFAIYEYVLSKDIYNASIPTANAYEVVQIGDRFGVVYDDLGNNTLSKYIVEHRENFDEIIKDYYRLLCRVNKSQLDNKYIMSAKQIFKTKVNCVSVYLTERDMSTINLMIEDIDECNNLIHGDLHVHNIIVKDNIMHLIDVGTSMKGSVLFEIASLYATYVYFDKVMHNSNPFFNLDEGTTFLIMEGLLKHFSLSSQELRLVCCIACIYLIRLYDDYPLDFKERFTMPKEEAIRRIYKYLKKDLYA